MPSDRMENTAEVVAPDRFHAELILEFFKEARKRGFYSGDDLLAPELMQVGGDFTNVMLLNERVRDRYKGDTAAYYHDVAETHLYAGAYYAHFWSLDHASVKDRNFAMQYLRSGARVAAEPWMTLSREETKDFCSALYDLFARRIEPYMEHPDLDSYIYYGMNAFFVVSVSVTAKRMGMKGEELPLDNSPPLNYPRRENEAPAPEGAPDGNDGASAVSGTESDLTAWQERLISVKKASITFDRGVEATEEGSPERFWADILSAFTSDAERTGRVDEKVPFPYFLVQPGVDFAYALMTSRPYYESNRDDLPRYYYKIARHCFYAGAYYAYLWDKQSTAYLDDGFHLKLLRAGLPAMADPLMPISREEVSKYCLRLYVHYMDEAARFAARPDYPVFVANGMHAFYMLGTMVQLKAMRIG